MAKFMFCCGKCYEKVNEYGNCINCLSEEREITIDKNFILKKREIIRMSKWRIESLKQERDKVIHSLSTQKFR